MKKSLTTYLLLALVFFASNSLKAQCAALNGTIATTSNPGEIEIDVDFNAVPNPADYQCFVSFYNITTGIYYQTGFLTQLVNPLLFTLPSNGSYSAKLFSNDMLFSCWDSLSIGNVAVTSIPTVCNYNLTSTMVSGQEYDFLVSTSSSAMYLWDFGDGTTGTGNPVSHIYTNTTGQYFDVTVIVVDSFCTDTLTTSIYAVAPTAPCGSALTGTIATTSNPGEVLIDIDFNAVPNPLDFSCYVHFYNITTGVNDYWTNTIQQWNNPYLFNLPLNGDYTAVLWATDTVANCWDSIAIPNVTISGLPSNCGASFTSSNSSPFDYTFDASLSYTGVSSGVIYSWDFGDGNVGTGNPINHTYTTTGNYTVSLTVSDSACNGAATSLISVTGSTCNINIVVNPINIETYEFTAYNNFGPLTTGATFAWDFGDGTTGTGNPITHIYTNPIAQVFTVTLITTDSACINTSTVLVYAGAIPPSCGATLNVIPDAPLSPGNTFEVTGTFSTAATIEWYFGDGNMSTLNPVYHLYNTTSGQNYFDVVCVVSDSTCTDSLYYQVQLGPNAQCEALFTLVQDTMNVGLYNGYNLSSVNGIANYFWSFGDGGYSYAQFPTHTYTATGVFDVCLTVTTNNNCADSMCFPLSVVIKAGTTINILDPLQNLSLEEKNSISDVLIFPNPSNGNFTIQIESPDDESSLIEVIDIYGRIIYSEYHLVNAGQNQLNLDLSEEAKSIYFLKINQLPQGKIILE